MNFEEIIHFLLYKINKGRLVNPEAKAEHDVLEELLYDMFGQEDKEI